MSSQAYTPGLKRKSLEIVQRIRRLPLPGEVIVKEGEKVQADTIVAKTAVPSAANVINVAVELDSQPIDKFAGTSKVTGESEWTMVYDLSRYMLKKQGDSVKKDETIAMYKGFFGLMKRYAKSPCDGTIERISETTGQIIIREPPHLLEINAYIPGKIVKVLPNEGVIVEKIAAIIQGIFGIGGETRGEIMMITSQPSEVLSAKQIGPNCTGKILIGGALVTGDALKEAVKVGVKGIIVGGVEYEDLSDFLGYRIGVAITGHEEVGLTLIILEGFGKMNISEKTFSLLKQFNGRPASINGATQIRAGVIRPEIIIPRENVEPEELARLSGEVEKESFSKGLLPGTPIRIIREPYFGSFGHVIGLPQDLEEIETESRVRVLEAELEDKRRVIVPRANVEIIEE